MEQNSDENLAFKAVEDEWEQDIIVKFTYEDKLLNEGAKKERERIKNLIDSGDLDIRHLQEKNKITQTTKKNVKLKVIGIDVSKLVAELEKGGFFDSIYKEDLIAWFHGSIPAEPISMNVAAQRFISLIADMKELKFIKNTKKYLYQYIYDSFLFNGEKPNLKYIIQIMKPSSSNRVSSKTKTIPNIQDFRR